MLSHLVGVEFARNVASLFELGKRINLKLRRMMAVTGVAVK